MSQNSNRYVDISQREFFSIINNFYSDFVDDYIKTLKEAKWNHFKWKGLTLMKDPMSLSTYQQLIQDLKPKTILEFGTFEGGSALWMHDLVATLELDCVIHTFDINQEQIKLPAVDGIHCHQLDNYKIKDFLKENEALFRALPHPILMIEDAHVNAEEIMTLLDPYLDSGDYLVVEDTFSESKHDCMLSFLKNNKYLVDTHYCDLWGYNNSWNINSFLVKA